MIGIDVEYRFLKPFGYINTIDLIGIGPCNNPFFMRDPSALLPKEADPDDIVPDRYPFGTHAFCSFSGMAFDACAGPALGSNTISQYLESTIDHSSTKTNSVYSEIHADICGVTNSPAFGFIKKLE